MINFRLKILCLMAFSKKRKNGRLQIILSWNIIVIKLWTINHIVKSTPDPLHTCHMKVPYSLYDQSFGGSFRRSQLGRSQREQNFSPSEWNEIFLSAVIVFQSFCSLVHIKIKEYYVDWLLAILYLYIASNLNIILYTLRLNLKRVYDI